MARKKTISLEEAKRYATMLYMQGVNQTEIARRVDVTKATITAWKDKLNWESDRAYFIIGRKNMLKNTIRMLVKMQDLINNTDEGIPTPSQSKTMENLASTIKKLEEGHTKDVIADVLTQFVAKISERFNKNDSSDKEFLMRLTSIIDEYILPS